MALVQIWWCSDQIFFSPKIQSLHHQNCTGFIDFGINKFQVQVQWGRRWGQRLRFNFDPYPKNILSLMVVTGFALHLDQLEMLF